MKPILSIIYVYYNTPEEINCSIKSLRVALGSTLHEIIIVDNASVKNLPKDLFGLPNVKIIKNSKNYGYGKAANIAATHASGKYFLIVNPDTKFIKDAIKNMLEKMEKDQKIGVLGPQVLNKNQELLQTFGGMPFLPNALFAFSFLNKLWPQNSFSKRYWLYDLNKNQEQEVDYVGGVCMLIKKTIFDKIGGFDENFFMYFEEADICYRVKKLGYKILFYPKTKIFHLIGKSTDNKEWIQKTFEKSRFYFFKKYHGFVYALLAEFFLRFITLNNLILSLILLTSLFLNLFRINELMPFIGDQGWFYLSARDIVLKREIPLLGITSSHTWIHQGPLWTYILALIFLLFGFNPVFPAYFTAILGMVTVIFIYKITKNMFTEKVALICAMLYSTSPLIIINSRMPYHTVPIPLLTIIFIYCLYKWIKGEIKYFPLMILFLSILYNFELSTIILWIISFLIFLYGLLKKEMWVKKLLNRNIILFSIISFLIPMIPILIYDFSHGFLQTIKFAGWIGYKVISFLGYLGNNDFSLEKIKDILLFFAESYKNIIFPTNGMIAFVIFVFTGIWFIYIFFRKKNNLSYSIIFFMFFIIIIAFLINQTPSQAYIPILFPLIMIITALFLNDLIRIKSLSVLIIILVLLVIFMNSYFLISNNYLTHKKYTFDDRLNSVKYIIKIVDDRKYNLIGKGIGSEYESFTMNYEYLLWWLGKNPSEKKQKLGITIQEDGSGIKIKTYESKN